MKELKDIDVVSFWIVDDFLWNPVKELKVVDDTDAAEPSLVVESGEGIERELLSGDVTAFVHVESGEGIESSGAF